MTNQKTKQEMRLGFFGFGKYTQAFAKRWLATVGGGDHCYFDPFLSIRAEEISTIKKTDSLEDLVTECDIIIIGLPNLVTDTIANILRLGLILQSTPSSIKCIVAFDGLPVRQLLNDLDLDLVGFMFNLHISTGDSPIGLYVRDKPRHPITNRFLEALKLLSSLTINLRSNLDLNFAKLLIGMGPAIQHYYQAQKSEFSSLTNLLYLYRDRCIGTNLDESVETAWDNGAIDRLSESLTKVSETGMGTVDIREIGLKGGPTEHLRQNLFDESSSLSDALVRVWQEYAREMLAFSFEGVARSIEWKSQRLTSRNRRGVIETLLHDGLKLVLDEWKGLLTWANIVQYHETGGNILYGSEDKSGSVPPIEKKVLELYTRCPERYRELLCSMSRLMTRSGQLDIAWLVQKVSTTEILFSGRHHGEVTGAHVVYLPSSDFDGIKMTSDSSSDNTIFLDLAALNPTASDRLLLKGQLSWLGSSVTDETIEMVWRYFAWLCMAYGPNSWRSAAFIPASRGRSIPLALTVGSQLSLGAPISTALSNLARSIFGLIIEWEAQQNASLVARAAIFSRNLSHNVGSHSLANSGFFAAVGVLHEEETSPGDLNDGGPVRKDMTRGQVWRARQRLGAFNSFIQGRLDFIARALGETTSTPEPMFFFGDIVQGFFSQRILLNTLLSDNGITIEDMEFHLVLPGMGKPAVFQGVNEKHDHQLRHVQFQCINGGALKVDSTPELKDVLVSVPGGMIGRHAFYAFLENIMRNAAKYGKKTNGTDASKRLIIKMEIKDGKAGKRGGGAVCSTPCYWLEVCDNRSVDLLKEKPDEAPVKGKVAHVVRRYLNDPVITPDGKAQSEGHGIQEMKACADFLASEEYCFPRDEEILAAESPTEALPWDENGSGADYAEYLNTNKGSLDRDKEDREGGRNSWIKEENALQAWDRELNDKLQVPREGENAQPHLTYRLILQKPVIFGIVDKYAGDRSDQDPICQAEHNASVMYYNNIETLAANPAYFGLILANDASEINSIIGKVIKIHHALPYRLMVVVPGDPDETINPLLKSVRNTIANNMVNAGDPFSDEKLPVRRLFAIACDGLFERTDPIPRAKTPSEIPFFREEIPDADSVNEATPADYEGLHLFKSVYEGWLSAWKGHEITRSGHNAWHLWIGFDRAGGEGGNFAVTQKWAGLKRFSSNIVHVKVQATGGVPLKNSSATSIPDPDAGSPALIVYDNHGNVFGQTYEGLSAAPGCWHEFSGSGQIDLFHSLETPPQDAFGLAFLIFSLLEASLLTIAVVDERVAEAMLENGKPFRERHLKLQLSRIFPVFQVRNPAEPKPHYLSPTVEEAVKSVDAMLLGNNPFADFNSQPEGLTFGSSEHGEGLFVGGPGGIGSVEPFINISASTIGGLSQKRNSQSNVDAIIVHEGVIDAIRSWWPQDQPFPFKAFYASTPFYVRTSGRGSMSRHGGQHLPFLEFSELSDTTYQAHNKFALGRSVLGLRGTIEE